MRKSRARARQPAEFDPRQPPEIPGVTGLTLLGTGGSASVYKGQETALRRPVAVKILHAQVHDPAGRSRFEGECARAGEVGEHRYAAGIYRREFADDWPYLVMRYYARGSMASAQRFLPQQPAGDALTICAKVACALQYAHNLSILHRDVKPENILLDGIGEPALADFGISTDLDDVTRTLHHAMTPAYAAPEVLLRGGGWPSSDVWSLAATLYALLAGHPPFYDPRHGDPRANLAALAGPLPPLGRPDVPDHVAATLTRALTGRHDVRTPSAQRFAEEINDDLTRLGLPPVPIVIEPDGQQGRSPAGPPPPLPQVSGFSPPPLAPQPSPAAPVPPDATGSGAVTGRMTSGAFVPYGHDTTHSADGGYVTGLVDASDPAHLPRQGQEQRDRDGGAAKKLILAGGGVAVVAVLAAAYALAAPKHQAAPGSGQDTSPSAAAPSVSPAAAAAATGPGAAASVSPAPVAPPQDVTAVAVSATSVRLTWTNAGSHVADRDVIVAMGAGYATRALPNKPPQVITGLTAGQPYCFAIGYYVASGHVSYSRVTASACVNGGRPAPAG